MSKFQRIILGGSVIASILAGVMAYLSICAIGSVGYMDLRGRKVINFQYDHAGCRVEQMQRFSDGLAWGITSDNHWCLIDHSGLVRVDPGLKIRSALPFSQGLSAIKVLDDKSGALISGYIDHDFRFVIPPRYSDCRPFAEGLAAVKNGKQWGFIDRSGQIVIGHHFWDCGSFREGLCEVTIRDDDQEKVGFIDPGGKFVISPNYRPLYGHFKPSVASPFVLTLSQDKLSIDSRPNLTLLPLHGEFSSGLAPVCVGGKIGHINHKGEMILPPRYRYASNFSEGLAIVLDEATRKFGFIDAKGNLIIPCKFIYVLPFVNGLTCGRESESELCFYYDHNGARVKNLSNKRCESFCEGLAPYAFGTTNPPGWQSPIPRSRTW